MNNFTVCFNAVFPAFVLMLIGYLTKLAGIISQKMVTAFNKVVFNIFMPFMVFYNLYNTDTATVIRPNTLLFCVFGVLAELVIGIIYAEKFVKKREDRAVIIMAAYRSNFAMIGIPIASSLVEDSDFGVIIMLLAVIIPIYNAVAVILLSIYGEKKVSVKALVMKILKNPLIIGSAFGIFFLLTGLTLPMPILKAAGDMAQVASPMLLFLVGAFFRFEGIGKDNRQLIAATLMRLVFMPGLCLFAAMALGFRGVDFAGFIGVFAASGAVGAYSMTQEMGGNARLAGNIVVITSVLSPLTVFIWSLLFKTLGTF